MNLFFIINNAVPYTAILLSLIGLVLATYTDLKERIVPNKLNFGLAIAGMTLFLIQSILNNTLHPLIYSMIGLSSGFLFGWVMWKIGLFAGGDVKLFMGLGALNPFTPAIIKAGILTNSIHPIFPITLFIYSLIAFLPYGIFVVITKLIKNKKAQKEIIEEMKPKIVLSIHAAIFLSSTYVILREKLLPSLLSIPILLIWGMLGKNKKIITLIVLIIAVILNQSLLTQALITTTLISVILYSILKLIISTKRVLVSEIRVKDLEEGMIPSKTLIWKGKKVIEAKQLTLKEVIQAIKNKNNKILKEALAPKKEIISAIKARGLNEEELKLVKELARKGLIPKKILIKESMPFVPVMLLGYIICLILGDAIMFLLTGGI